MVSIYFKDRECEEAKLYNTVGRLYSRLLDAINEIPRAPRAECGIHIEQAFRTLDELILLRGSDIPLADVDDFAQQTRIALQSLAHKSSGITEESDATTKELWTMVSVASNCANRLCDCLIGFTKESEKLLRKKIIEKDQEIAAAREPAKKRNIFSLLKLWKRSDD